MIIAEDAEQAHKVLDHLDELPEMITVVQIDGSLEHELVIGWSELIERGEKHLAEHPDARRAGDRRHRARTPCPP